MEAKAPLVLELPKPLNEKHLDELNSYDLTKLLFNKINSLNRPKQPAKSRSGSINELPPYSPTKLAELNFYTKTKDESDVDEPESSDDEDAKSEQDDEANIAAVIRKNSATDQTRSSNQILTKLLQFKQIKQLNELLGQSDPQHGKMPISLQDQLELDSLSSSEPNREWNIDSNEFALQCLNRHNFLRKRHNVPNLILSKNVRINSFECQWCSLMLFDGIFL